MYNEDYSDLETTLNAIYENLILFSEYGIDSGNIAVVVIFDGIQKIHQSVMDLLF